MQLCYASLCGVFYVEREQFLLDEYIEGAEKLLVPLALNKSRFVFSEFNKSASQSIKQLSEVWSCAYFLPENHPEIGSKGTVSVAGSHRHASSETDTQVPAVENGLMLLEKEITLKGAKQGNSAFGFSGLSAINEVTKLQYISKVIKVSFQVTFSKIFLK